MSYQLRVIKHFNLVLLRFHLLHALCNVYFSDSSSEDESEDEKKPKEKVKVRRSPEPPRRPLPADDESSDSMDWGSSSDDSSSSSDDETRGAATLRDKFLKKTTERYHIRLFLHKPAALLQISPL